ncbi:ATPase, T2SS/T4P/T4SS family [Allopusillimonas soli]|uniref:Flp pilus assembly complex ATPase component TadA n=1 Tax=Allopusillimonas soli TaxID=659016 RepID=A0A853FAN8_9BURK|nr:ATPase, T2SS/T4P/T4SS family [Allopusillimonas soli]NYT36999.1 Flp pilus assembly complex ATPase component TadA [Allopusillimonas soli]
MIRRYLRRRRPATGLSGSSDIQPRFNTADAVVLPNSEALLAMQPGALRALTAELGLEMLSGRLAPVLLESGDVALFALAEHVAGDQAEEVLRRVKANGYLTASPQRYVVTAPMLQAVLRGQGMVAGRQSIADVPDPSRPALGGAFHDLVSWGVRHGATDIHLNVHRDREVSEVRYTIDGRYVQPDCFKGIATSVLLDMLSVAWMDIRGGNGAVFDPGREQQGVMALNIDGAPCRARWSSLAAESGPSVCLRLLSSRGNMLAKSLDGLGYLPDQTAQIQRALNAEGGAVIFAGAVGAGKSTTLAVLLHGLAQHRKVVTIEDPVEYAIPGAIQNSIARDLGHAAHEAYAAKLRAVKRSAAHDVLLGEIRDRETGRAFMDLASSGVNVYATVHALSADLIPARLASDFIGVSKDFLATPGMLRLLVYQALIPALCQRCAQPADRLLAGAPGADGQNRCGRYWQRWLDILCQLYERSTDTLRIRNPEGCEACSLGKPVELRGYEGHTLAAEVVEPAMACAPEMSAMACAVDKAFAGMVDPRDVEPRFRAFETELIVAKKAGRHSPHVGHPAVLDWPGLPMARTAVPASRLEHT